ncbi:MAG TPA: IS21 family transposase [bacterium]|nr:IS21 family transposase [bacterium]
MRCRHTERTLRAAADKAGMDEKTARKYLRLGRLPSEVQKPHTWRTRPDPFEAVWPEAREFLEDNAGLEAKTLFEHLQRRHPGRFQDGQLRTFQRRVKEWRARQGPAREVMFPQRHKPGRLAQSDFTRMATLGVTIAGQPFPHMICHFVLTYSNWEAGTICFSESFESLAEGLQNALWELGGAPATHQTDCLSAAVSRLDNVEEFTQRYRALLSHYGLQGHRGQPGSPHENGDVEQRHHRFKRAVDQALILRGSRDFESRQAYELFLANLFKQLNAGRTKRLAEEIAALRRLPLRRFEAFQRRETTVGPNSTIRVLENVYSVHSRLIGEKVCARVYADHIDVWRGRTQVERLARLRGRGKHTINYRHIIDWLVRKPGAFERYLYRDALFPTSRFRMAYDVLEDLWPARGHKEYLKILELAAKENEAAVDGALHHLLKRDEPLSAQAVEALVAAGRECCSPRQVRVDAVQLGDYDVLLEVI